MNLHGIAAGAVSAVNPFIPATVRISTGPSATSASGHRTPTYATPGAFVGSIADQVLTVDSQTDGKLQAGQTIAGAGVAGGTEIVSQLTGAAGGVGTYQLDRPSTVSPSVAMTAALVVQAQIQPITWRDLQQLDGVNLEGTRIKAYLYGKVDGLVRASSKGGDLVTIDSGPYAGTYLVAQILEQFPDWVCAALTLQNGS